MSTHKIITIFSFTDADEDNNAEISEGNSEMVCKIVENNF